MGGCLIFIYNTQFIEQSNKTVQMKHFTQRKYGSRFFSNGSLPKVMQLFIQKQIANQASLKIQKSQDSLLDKYSWVHRQSNYDEMEDSTIMIQNKKLRAEFSRINGQVDVFLKKVNEKSMYKAKNISPDENLIRERQISNNNFILNLYGRELKTLKVRQKRIILHSREQIGHTIEVVKQKLNETKKKNRDLKIRSRTLGDSICNTNNLFQEIQVLFNQIDIAKLKKKHLQQKVQQTEDQIKISGKKHINIQRQFEMADVFIKKNKEISKEENSVKKNREIFKQKQQIYDLSKKKMQLMKANKQQQYHSKLQGMVQLNNSIKIIQTKISETELQLLQVHDHVKVHEEKLNQLKKKKNQRKLITNQIKFEIKSDISSIPIREQLSFMEKSEKKMIDANY